MAPTGETDVLVIGGGMAGAIAALSARRMGAKVLLARNSVGATALSSGAIDVAPDPVAAPGDWGAHLLPLEVASQEIARTRPHHPYAVLRSSLPRLRESLDFAVSKLGGLLSSPGERNMLLVSALGTFKPTALAQRQQSRGDLSTLPENTVLIQFALVPDYDARLIAQGIERGAAYLHRPLSLTIVTSRLFGESSDALQPPYALARKLQALPLEFVLEELRRIVPPETQTVLFPPMMGIDVSWLDEVSKRLAIPCAEILATGPSVPGLRLQRAIDSSVRENGVGVLETEVRWSGSDGLVTAEGSAVRPASVVLATGKFIGGGITRDKVFRERVFDLPVYSAGRRLTDQYIGHVLGERMSAYHPAFRAGIRVDSNLRAKDAPADLAKLNLFAAGSVLSGFDPAADKTGLGLGIFTGYLAGENAARAISNGRF